MSKEFDLDKVYTKKLSKKELLKIIDRCYNKEFIVSFLPRSKNDSDILIRSTKDDLNKNRKIYKG